MSSRSMPRQTGPGPAAYSLPSTFGFRNCDARKKRGPQYSFGLKPSMPAYRKQGPGPAEYRIGQMTRFGNAKGLEFSMRQRVKMNKPHLNTYT